MDWISFLVRDDFPELPAGGSAGASSCQTRLRINKRTNTRTYSKAPFPQTGAHTAAELEGPLGVIRPSPSHFLDEGTDSSLYNGLPIRFSNRALSAGPSAQSECLPLVPLALCLTSSGR